MSSISLETGLQVQGSANLSLADHDLDPYLA